MTDPRTITVGDIEIGSNHPFALIAGPASWKAWIILG